MKIMPIDSCHPLKNQLVCKMAGRSGSAKANGLEPHAYLSYPFVELPKASPPDHLEALLPWNARLVLSH